MTLSRIPQSVTLMRYFAPASDYDGTLADHGTVRPPTLTALKRFRDAGRQLLLVTGRKVADLMSIFPEYEVFHWIGRLEHL